MFGQDNSTIQPQPSNTDGALNAAMPDPITTANTAIPPAGFSMPAPSEPPTQPVSIGAPALPTSTDQDAPVASGIVPPDTDALDQSAPAESNAGTPVAVSDDLLAIKQQALDKLSPLVGHLDQTPEEKFRTTMMMIQASDNKDLIKDAYESAQAITDDKARAQALLDVINEINYFTQQDSNSSPAA